MHLQVQRMEALARNTFSLQRHAVNRAFGFWEQGCHLLASAEVDHLPRSEVLLLLGRHHLAVAQYSHPVHQLHHLAETVGDEDDRIALRLQQQQGFEQLLDFLEGQRGGGLIQNDQLAPRGEFTGDLHQLPYTHRDLRDQL